VPGELVVPGELEREVSGSWLQNNTQRTDEQLCDLIRLHSYLLAEAHATQMTSDLPETETGPSIQCLARVSSLNTITSCLSTRRAIVRTQLVLPWQITQHVEVNGNQTPFDTGECAKWSLIPINFDMLRDLPGQYQLGSNYCAPSAQARCDRIQ
jgi:hypothetical protein